MKRAMRRRKTWQRQAAAITAAMMAMSVGGIAYAMPQGEVIRSGKGEITRHDELCERRRHHDGDSRGFFG